MMLTTDLSLREDPAYRRITQRWLEKPQEFEAAFARAWFKLIHRDMGPASRYRGPSVPTEAFIWQDPVPKAGYQPIDAEAVLRDGMAYIRNLPRLLESGSLEERKNRAIEVVQEDGQLLVTRPTDRAVVAPRPHPAMPQEGLELAGPAPLPRDLQDPVRHALVVPQRPLQVDHDRDALHALLGSHPTPWTRVA